MELKNYQKKVMDDLSVYLNCLNEKNDLFSAWEEYWNKHDINVGFGGVPTYNNNIVGVPQVCMKVPTGGGKTFMACTALRRIFGAMPSEKPKVVVWLVPSDSILKQTLSCLSNPSHPYRQRLDMDFSGKVEVYSKDQLLNGQNFSPDTVRDMLTVCVLSYASLRISSLKKEDRKVYQENGNLLRFANYFNDNDVLLADTPDTALIQVLRQLSPVTIVDESHNAESDLSTEMLNNVNPSFILDLTATPKEKSNVLCYVDAKELKKEHMVKLPVIVFNRTSINDVIRDTIQLRANIEKQAREETTAEGNYIRPIALFQAQPNIKGKNNTTFQKIKDKLIEIGIPKEEIAIKTSDVDELGDTNLMSSDCKIKYIITVNALKEGWDCPFAYILSSLANKTSKVDVEQIVGRILRQPYTRKYDQTLLNTSYVLTCSNDFHETLENVVTGLNQAGFSKKDYRVGETPSEQNIAGESNTDPHYEQQEITPIDNAEDNTPGIEDFENVSAEDIREQIKQDAATVTPSNEVASMIQIAQTETAKYEEDFKESESEGLIGGELGTMIDQHFMQSQFKEDAESICMPQFFLRTVPDLFGNEYELLEKNYLSKGFSLAEQDAHVNFELSSDDIYSVDIATKGESVPKYRPLSKKDAEFLKDSIEQLPPENRINACVDQIAIYINHSDTIPTSDIKEYVKRIISGMSDEELSMMQASLPSYTKKIKEKIDALEGKYRENQFFKLIDNDTIICKESYKFAKAITAPVTTDSIPNSLYEAEKKDMDEDEKTLLDKIAALPNVLWWHRIIERNDFHINGFINHYPDFVVRTTSGKTALVEVKGDHLNNDDSQVKLKLGRKWQDMAGREYKYYMVFKNRDTGLDGAYPVDEFIDMFKSL